MKRRRDIAYQKRFRDQGNTAQRADGKRYRSFPENADKLRIQNQIGHREGIC